MSARDPDATRARVLESALRAFSSQGFRAASTNAIAEDAEVAKGLVFHHFGTKEGLFMAVYEQTEARVRQILFNDRETLPPDLFERLHAFTVRKLKLMQREPTIYRFFATALTEAPPKLRAAIEDHQRKTATRVWVDFLENVDTSSLRSEIDLESAVDTITLLSEGIEKRLPLLIQQGLSVEELTAWAWEHYERLKRGLYRPTEATSTQGGS